MQVPRPLHDTREASGVKTGHQRRWILYWERQSRMFDDASYQAHQIALRRLSQHLTMAAPPTAVAFLQASEEEGGHDQPPFHLLELRNPCSCLQFKLHRILQGAVLRLRKCLHSLTTSLCVSTARSRNTIKSANDTPLEASRVKCEVSSPDLARPLGTMVNCLYSACAVGALVLEGDLVRTHVTFCVSNRSTRTDTVHQRKARSRAKGYKRINLAAQSDGEQNALRIYSAREDEHS